MLHSVPSPHSDNPPEAHWPEWIAELAGTALLMVGGLGAVTLDFGSHSPIVALLPSHSARLLLTGALFAATGALVALSPLGRTSGAHLNPAVSLAFWLTGKMRHHDLGAYICAQIVGACLGVLALRLAFPEFATVRYGMTMPGPSITPPIAALIEAGMTSALVLTILVFVSDMRTARWTPLAAWAVITLLVWQGAPLTGTSLNPARSVGPALIALNGHDLWIYLVGPPAGAILATWLVLAGMNLRPVTAKLFHDPAYRSIFKHEPGAMPTNSVA
ncbi:MAG TPA: aquaporin [Candidatus Acidoferrales bacterium]|nr:aquaporin [Candidatus Acidoferrales bacterium]